MAEYTIQNSSGDILLANTMPEAEYMYGCTPTAVGMILGYYDLYGYRGTDLSNLIDGVVDLKSRGTDGNAYNMDAFDTVLGRAIASEDYVYRFYSRGDLDVITGKKAGTYWTTSVEEELEYSFVNGGEGPDMRTDIWNCIAGYLGTGQIWRGNDNLSTSISQSTLEDILNYEMNINYNINGISRIVDWRFTSMLYGLYLYVEDKGYSLDREITGTYVVDVAGGEFTFEDYKAEIDAGRPVLISIEGHSMVGYGYNPETDEIIFDDCYRADQRMVWGGVYHYSDADLPLQSITVIGLMASNDLDLAVEPVTVDSSEMFFSADFVPLTSGDYCYPDNTICVNFTVSNLGSTACGSFAVSVYVDGSLTESILILSLEGNSSEEYTDIQLYDLTPGLHTVRVVADGINEIQELSGSNNVLEQKLMVLKDGANVVTGLKQVGPGQVSTDDYVASGWQMHVLNGGTASGTMIRGIVTNVAVNGMISYLPGLTVVSQGGLLQDVTVYEYGKLQVGGSAANINVYENGSAAVSNGGVLTGTIRMEKGAEVSFEEGAVLNFDLTQADAGGDALVNDLSLVAGTPVYTLTVSETLKRGVYALADGATAFIGTISVGNTTGDDLGSLSVGETLTVGDIDLTLDLTGSALSVSVEKSYAAVSSGLVLTNQIRTVGENELYQDTTVNSGGILKVEPDGTASRTTVNIGGNLNVSSGGTALEIVEKGGSVSVEVGANVTFLPNTLTGVLTGKAVSATIHSGTTANDLTLNEGSWLRVFSGGIANAVTVNRVATLDVCSGGTASGLTVNTSGYLYVSSGGSADDVTLLSGFRLTVSRGGTATNVRMTPFEGNLEIGSGAYVTYDWNDLSGVYYGTKNRLVSHVQQLDSPGILSNKTYSMYVLSGAVVSGVNVMGECHVGYGGEMKEVFLESTMNIYSGGMARDIFGQRGKITIYSGGTLTGRVAGMDGSSCICHEGAVVNVDLTTTRPRAAARITDYRVFSGTPTFTVTVSDDQQEGSYLLIGRVTSSFNKTITVTNTRGEELGTLTVNSTKTISGVNYRLTTSNSNLVLKIGDKETPSPYTSDGLIIFSGMTPLSSGGIFYDTLINGGSIDVRNGTLESTVVHGRGSISLRTMRYGENALASNTVLNYGTMRISSGGTAIDTIINSGGTLTLSSFDQGNVPTAIRTTINSSGSMRIDRSGFASDVTVNAGGILSVINGAHVMAVRENGGNVSAGTGDTIIFTPNTFSGLVLKAGKATVHSGTTAVDTVLNGAALEIFHKGIASGVVVNVGGALFVSSGGTAVDVDWEPFRGTITVASGATVTYTSTYSGVYYGTDGQLVSHDLTMNSPVLDSNQSAYVMSDGTATDPTVGPGAFLTIFNGGTASGVREAGGYVEVMENAEVTFQSNAFSGLELTYMSATVHSGTTAVETNLGDGGRMEVYSGGSAVTTTVNDGGELNISGGKADHTTLDFGRMSVFSGAATDTIINYGEMEISGKGIASGITVNNGSLSVCSGGSADSVIVNDGGSLYVSSGGKMSNITVNETCGMVVSSGGSADGIAVNNGGWLAVSSGGTATNIVWTPFENYIDVYTGATVTFAECSGVYVGIEGELFSQALTMESVTLDDTTSMYVMKDGAARNTTIDHLGWMTVSSGGTADETSLNDGGWLEVFGGIADRTTMNGGEFFIYSGGTADRTTLNSGWMEISSGGAVNRTTVNSGCNLEISKGVIANDTTVNSGGGMEVSSGGVATGIRENGGYVEVRSGAEATFLATTIDGLALTDGSATVHSGTTALSAEIGSGAWLEIYSGGTADHATVTSGGSLNVSSGGVATEILENGGYVEVEAGAEVTFQTNVINGLELMTYRSATVHSGTTAVRAVIGSGGWMEVFSGGTADNTTVTSGGWMEVYSGGTADNATVTSGGRINVYSGGTATNITWTPFEGNVYIEEGTSVTFANENKGVYIGTENKLLSQALTMESVTLDDSTSMYVMKDGVARNTTVNYYGWLTIFSGGTATETVLTSGGYLEVSSGGTADNTMVNSGGDLYVSSGGTADHTTVSSGGTIEVWTGGIADHTTVTPGGDLHVSSGGTATNVVWTPFEGTIRIEEGASVSFVSEYNGVYLGTENKLLSQALTMESVTLDDTISMYVMKEGTANNTTVSSDGMMEVSSGGTADHTTVKAGGILIVSSGGTAANIVWTPCEGTVSIADGACVTFADEYSGVYLGSGNRLISRAQVMDQIVLSGWNQSMYVMAGGTADNTTVFSNGSLFVSGGGLASRTDVQSGRMQVQNGGFAVETTLAGGRMEVRNGGIAGFTTIDNYGSLTIFSGGSANYVMINSGILLISGSGTAENIFLLNNDYRCSMFVLDGAVARNVTVGSRGRVSVSSGGKLTGIVTCRNSSFIRVENGAIINFDLTQTSPGQTVLFNDLSRLSGTPDYTITVRAGTQQEGVYLLAAGASVFDSCITVVNTDGLELGALSTGETVLLSGAAYTLGLANDLLFLTIGNNLTPPAQTSSGTLVENGSKQLIASGDLFYDTMILSGGDLQVLSGGIAAGISVQADGRLAVFSGGTATGIEAVAGAYLGLSVAEDTWIAGTSAGSAFELKDGVISGYTAASGYLDVLEGGTANDVTVKAGGSLHVADGGTATDIVWTPCEGRVEIEDGASATFAGEYSGVYYGANDRLLSHAAVLNALSIDSAAGAYVMSGGTAANASVKAGGSLHVASGGTAADIVWTPCEGRVEIEDGASATFAGAYSGVYYGSNDRLLSHAASLDDLSIDSAGTAFVMNDGAATRTAVYSGGSLIVSSGGIAFTTNVCSGGRLLVGFSGLVSGVTLAAEGEFRLGPGGYAIAVSIDSAGSMTVCSGGTAIAMSVNSGGRMVVRESGSVIGAVVGSGGITEMNGALSIAEVSGGGRLDVLSRGSASGVIVDADGSMTVCSGGIATETGVSGLLTVSGGKVTDTSIEQDGSLLVFDGIIENVSVRAGGTLIVSSGATLTGHLACEDGSVISVSGQATLNLDLSRMAPGSEWMIGDLSLVEGTPAYTVTVNAAEQQEGLYLLADGASGFDQSITVRNTDGTLLGALSAGDAIDVSGTTYRLRRTGSQLVLSIGGTASPDPDTTSGFVIYDNYGEATVSSRTVLDTLILSGSMIVSNCGVASRTTVKNGVLYVSFGGIASDTVLMEHGVVQVQFGGTMNGVSVNDDCSLHIFSHGLANDVTVNSNGYVKIRTGGSASNVRIGSEGAIWLYGGACVSDLVIDSGGYMELSIAPETDISGTYAGSSFEVKNGLLSDFRIDSGTLYITSGTTVDNLIINPGATVQVFNGGSLFVAYNPWMISSCVKKVGPRYYYNSSTIRYLDRDANVYYGGTTSGLIRKADELDSMTVTSGNSLIVYQDGTVRDMTVRSGGSMIVLSGATMTGRMTFENGADISAEDGAVLHFDLTGATAGKAALVNDLSFIQGSPLYALTVSGMMPNGIYSLAGNAAGFTGTISVTNEDGDALGMLAVGETLRIGEINFKLSLTDSLLSVTVDGPPPPMPSNLNGSSDKVSWKATGAEQYVVEYSTDGFEHVIQVVTTKNTVDILDLPAGTYQWRVKTDASSEWAVGEAIVSESESAIPKVVQSNEDGNEDLFFVTPVGTWENIYFAQHVGSINDWGGTNEILSAAGKGRIQNIFFGSTDPNVLCLTDGENGDAIFVDDVYTDLPEKIAEHTARLYKIQEIRAGAGADIVDMTSQQFEYVGDGLTIRGGAGNDTIWANKGDNKLFGDAGNDRIVGASGNDVIAGGIGNDRMHGGGGDDVFTFCDNWGVDNVEQLATGSVTLWFASGDESNWNTETLTYTDGDNSVKVSGVAADKITLKFGDDGFEQFATLSGIGAFFDATTERIFEEPGKGILASL